MKHKILIFFGSYILFQIIGCGDANNNLRYLNQSPPDSIPEKFAPRLISSDVHSETGCTVSKDLKEIYFTRSGGGLKTPSIFCARFTADSITEEYVTSFEGFGPYISPDGEKMIISKFMLDSDSLRTIGLWILNKQGKDWTDPEYIIEGSRASISNEGNIYYIDRSNENDRGVIVYRRIRNGKYSESKVLGGGINTEFYEAHPCIAHDESYLIFDSDRPGGNGQGDLYISFRIDSLSWGDAINLGNKINSEGYEAYASISPDNKYLFYSSNVDGSFDIYWIDLKIISNLQKSAGSYEISE